jgi:integrase/recombinase XerD
LGRYPWIPCANAFLESIKPYYAPTTQRTMKRGLRAIGGAFQELRQQGLVTTTDPRRMTQGDIEAFLRWMRERKTRNGIGLKPPTQANYMEYLSAVLLKYDNYVMDRMRKLHYVRFAHKVAPEVKVLSMDDIERIRDSIRDMPGWDGDVARFIVPMYAHSGLRRSELRRARLTDLDTAHWTLRVAHPKGEGNWACEGTSIVLRPAWNAVADFLVARKRYLASNGIPECEMLIPRVSKDGKAGYWTDGMWGKLKDDVQKRSGIPFRIQYLRASFGQIAKDRGVSIESVSRALRHKTTQTTELYYARIRVEDSFKELQDAFKEIDDEPDA